MNDYLPAIIDYLTGTELPGVPGWALHEPFSVAPLAQGEYNMNYIISQGPNRWGLRANVDTQIDRDDQILYEYRALRLLAPSGVTPRPYYVDASEERFPLGLLIMEYLPGEPLDYERDLTAAARLFARIHALDVPATENHLIRERAPLSETFEESTRLLATYLDSPLADPALVAYFHEVLAWADAARRAERFFVEDPWPCIINTEVNSGNFIANREADTLHLVDWEKPLWGDPSQDLSHFCVPTTTLWKTGYRMSANARRAFLDAYRAAIPDAHLRDTIGERVRLRDPFNCLRGISWSAYAWVAYQSGDHQLRNEDTFRTVSRYLDIGFVRSLFDPFLENQPERLWHA